MRDITLGDTIYLKFTTRAFATGIPTTLAGTPVLSVYEENNLVQITAGVSIAVDYDAVTGLHQATIVATAGNGYESGKSYDLVITTGTVGGVSVVGEVVGSFTVQAFPVNWAKVSNPTTVVDLAATDIQLADTATAVTNTVPANVTQLGGVVQSLTDLKDFADAGYDPATNKITGVVLVDTTAVNTDMVAAAPTAGANANAIWDALRSAHVAVGSFGQGVASVQGAVTGSVASVTGAAGSVTGSVGSLVGHTAQTGDSFARLAAPVGASISADIAAIPTTAMRGTDGVDTTPMRGTDNAALASVLGALADAAAAGDPTVADTLIQYVKQLVNLLAGTAGIGTMPAAADPANGVNLFEMLRASMGATFATATHSNEAIIARGNTAWVTGGGGAAATQPPVQVFVLQAGATSKTLPIFIASDTAAGGKTGLAFDSGGVNFQYRRGAVGASTSIVPLTQTVTGAWTTLGFVEIDAANFPGMYRFDLEDAMIASGVDSVLMMMNFTGAMAMPVLIVLTADDPLAAALTAAQINTEVDTALSDVNLDHLVGTATAIPALPAGTWLDLLLDDGTAVFDRTTDSLQALRDNQGGSTPAAIATAVHDELTATARVAGSYGQLHKDNLDAAITSRLAPTVAARTLDVSVTGEAGLDWANIGSPATAVDLAGTDINLVDLLTGHTAQTGDSFARIGLAGAGLTNINLPNQTMDIVGSITGNLSGSVGSVTGAVGSVTGAVTVGTINVDVIDSVALAATAVTEIVNGVWDELRSGHITADTFGSSFYGFVEGLAQTGTLSTTQMTTDLTEATDSHYIGRTIVFLGGILHGQATDVTAYTGATKLFTFTAVTEAPLNNQRFILV